MGRTYHPTVREVVHPTDGGWTKERGSNVLLLQIPEFKAHTGEIVQSFDYAWLYDSTLKAYIFCFKLSDGTEKAVIFEANHAGLLLTDLQSYETFALAITHQSLERLDDQTSMLFLPGIDLHRSLTAGW